MRKRIGIILMTMIIAVSLMPVSAFAGSKQVKMTGYDKVYKQGNTIYCSGEGYSIYKVRLRGKKVASVRRLCPSEFVISERGYNHGMKKKGKYLYYVAGSSAAYSSIWRINVNTGKQKLLAKSATDYAIKGGRLYTTTIKSRGESEFYTHWSMKLNGKAKKKTSKKAVMKFRNSNAKGYSVRQKMSGAYVTTYLKTPAGTYKLGRSALI